MPTRRSALFFLSLMAVIPLVTPLWTLPAIAKDKGNGNSGKGNGNNNGGRNGKGSASSSGTGNADPSAASSSTTAEVRHRNGLKESIVRGRYIMKDNKGRTIVNRRASRADSERLEALQR